MVYVSYNVIFYREEKPVAKKDLDHSLLLETFAKLCLQMNEKVTPVSHGNDNDVVSKFTSL